MEFNIGDKVMVVRESTKPGEVLEKKTMELSKKNVYLIKLAGTERSIWVHENALDPFRETAK